MAHEWLSPSWTQLHRMGQISLELAEGLHNPHYTVRAESVSPALNHQRLAGAWRQVMAAHPVLGSCFDLRAGGWWVPVEGAGDAAPVLVEPADFATALLQPFHYLTGPVARLVVAGDSTQTWVGLAIEHLVSDGWTLNTVFDDLVSAYLGAPLRYENGFTRYVARQHEVLGQPTTQRRIEHLSKTLAGVGGAIPALRLESAEPRVSISSALHKAETRHSVDDLSWQRVLHAATLSRLSAPNIMLAAFHAALARITSRSAVGSTLTLAHRHHAQDRGAAGWFAGKLTVPADTTNAESQPLSYLSSWQEGLWHALDHSDIPWAYLVHLLNPEEFGRFTSIPFATFNFQPWAMHTGPGTAWPDAESVAPIKVGTGSRDAALATFWLEGETGVDVIWDHRVDVVSEQVATELWLWFSEALDHLCDAVSGSAARAVRRAPR